MSAQAFPEHEGLEELVSDGEYELIVLNVCPSHLGFPVKRPRKFMLLVNTSTMSWNPHAAENQRECSMRCFIGESKLWEIP